LNKKAPLQLSDGTQDNLICQKIPKELAMVIKFRKPIHINL